MTGRTDYAATIRQAVTDLVDERDQYRREAGQLRLAGMVLIKYLERLAAGKTAGIIQGEEVRAAVQTIREK